MCSYNYRNHIQFFLACLIMAFMPMMASQSKYMQNSTLQLPDIYSDGMIMQRNQFLPINGKSLPGKSIVVQMGNDQYQTIADENGNWSVTLRPVYTGINYTMTVSDGNNTIKIKDILAGEVWIASGQSNMEFRLSACATAKEDIANANDSLLRFYNMTPRAITNSKRWDEQTILKINNLDYFTPTKWESSTPETAKKWSAIAYHFGKTLRDSLNVPIGIILNAIGGSPTESWIDRKILEKEMPAILADWENNPGIMPWVRQRTIENIGDDTSNLHPYKPGYLFSTGINPLKNFATKGVIWYQGESNAHDVKLHEKLFELLCESWRQSLGNDDLPFVYAQLSSIDRESWPEFRNSQRKLLETIPHTSMVVTSDKGDSLDVHPTQKREIGQRMSFAALRDVYGHDISAYGPILSSIIAEDGCLILTFDNSTSLKSNGDKLIGFEIAEKDSVFKCADATIKGNKIILENKDMRKPIFVRYGWQPFTRANLINEAGLPASTFDGKATNANDYEIESGYDKGVSGTFFGTIEDKLILAGGCNFPVDPLAPGSQKKFYKGIYAVDTDNMQWTRIGSLVQPIAYGMSATTPYGIVLIGGTNGVESINDVNLLTLDGLKSLPSLPYNIDNGYAAAFDNNIYVIGGNANGKPSNNVLMLDLLNLNEGWKKISEFPGNPRVQPVAATAKNNKGEECIYIFGGFAPRHDGKEPTVNTDGLCFNTKTKKWSHLKSPVKDGEELCLGGGNALTTSDNKIMASGGVNKDIFLSALTNQAPDYLEHPEEWYRFNSNLLLFDPILNEWTIITCDRSLARAGAALMNIGTNLYISGGELKPRIRTSQIVKIENIVN